jgi:zona occludens toxin (predicted ATPase)
MAITMYSGTPGSGKSLHLASEIWENVRKFDHKMIMNFPIDEKKLANRKVSEQHVRDLCHFVSTSDLSPKYLRKYCRKHLSRKKEHQCTVIIDECGILFNKRIKDKLRMEWIELFTKHRKLGFDFILVTQSTKYIDDQILGCLETEVVHRDMKHYKIWGWILSFMVGGLFSWVEVWYVAKLKCRGSWFRYNAKKAAIYDTFYDFYDDDLDDWFDDEPIKCATV